MDEKEKLKASLDQIHAEESLKTSTKKYLFEKVYFKEKKRPSPLRKFAAAAVCSLAVFIGGGSWLFFTPTAFISVDVNPSLELGINRFDRIVSVTGYNEDGRALARDLHIKYMDYTDALETLMEDQNMEVYMADNADVVLTVAGDNAAKSSEILDNVESCMSEHQNVYCHSGNSEEVHHAHDAGLSFGKYQAWQVLQDLDPDITLEEVQDMTMSEIRDLIWKYSQEKSPDEDLSTESENIQGSRDPDTSQGSTEDSSDTTEGSSDEDDLSETVRQGHHGHQHHGDGTDD